MFVNAYYFDLNLLFLDTSAEGCAIRVRTKGMNTLSLNPLPPSQCLCSGKYRTSCASLLQQYVCICHTYFLSAPAKLQMNVPDWSTKELIALTLIASSFDDEKKRSLAGFQALTGCHTAKTFTSKSEEAWTKHFLQAGNMILNAFCRYPQRTFQ